MKSQQIRQRRSPCADMEGTVVFLKGEEASTMTITSERVSQGIDRPLVFF